MLLGLGHGVVSAKDDEDGATQMGRADYQVLDVVSVVGAVDVGIVAILGLVLDSGSVDGDVASTLPGAALSETW